MCQYQIANILLLFLFTPKEILSTQATCATPENDITEPLNTWISSVFTIDTRRVSELFEKVQEHDLKDFHYQSNLSQPEYYFPRVTFYPMGEAFRPMDSEEWGSDNIYWKYGENKMRVFNEKTFVLISGNISSKGDPSYASFRTYLRIRNFTFTAVAKRLPTNSSRVVITHDFTLDGYSVGYENDTGMGWRSHTLNVDSENEKLTQKFSPALPAMLGENFIENVKFKRYLADIVSSFLEPQHEITSKYADLLENPNKFHYLIPSHPFLQFTLKPIIIRGLSNLDSYEVHEAEQVITHTLLVKNIEGSITLEYGMGNEPALEMNFQAGLLNISMDEDTSFVYVHAINWRIVNAKTNAVLDRRIGSRGDVMRNALESAIATSMFPKMEVGKVWGAETPLRKIQIVRSSDWETIKESYQGFVPFNDDK